MSDRFQHVMVLTSIIIGLGITNLLSWQSAAGSIRFLRLASSLIW
jgi:multisubunit Na+/H+ antiporter MnhC subunit